MYHTTSDMRLMRQLFWGQEINMENWVYFYWMREFQFVSMQSYFIQELEKT